MITQIDVDATPDYQIQNHFGDVYPFYTKILSIIESNNQISTFEATGLLLEYIRRKWDFSYMRKVDEPNAVGMYLHQIFSNPKNIF